MSLLEGNKSILTFNLLVESVSNFLGEGGLPLRLTNLTNSEEWMGKEPGSCRVIDVQQHKPVPIGKTATIDHAEFTILVGYRPDGWISDVREDIGRRLNGWKLEVRDQKTDGTLLDGKGQPLPPGAEPVYLTYDVCHREDFNQYDFGHLVSKE